MSPQKPHPVRPAPEPEVTLVEIRLCSLCLNGEGGECHVPGCAIFLRSAPDLPLESGLDYATVQTNSVRVSAKAVRMVLRWLAYPASNPALCRDALDEFDAALRPGPSTQKDTEP
jgi:hypothetical protein